MSVDALRFEGVSKGFAARGVGTIPVLADLDLVVGSGESVSILGPSGSGKSTLLRLAAGLERLGPTDRGSIKVDGLEPGDGRARTALVFQAYSTFPWLSAERNVMLALRQAGTPRAERRASARLLLEGVRLTSHERRYPDELSGGQRQRLAFACAIALRPALLLLDEPLGALDPITREHLQLEVVRLLRDQASAMLLVTHDIAEAVLLGERVILLSSQPGRILLELNTRAEKPWLADTAAPGVIAQMVRDYRRSQRFLDLTNRLRDALGDHEGQV